MTPENGTIGSLTIIGSGAMGSLFAAKLEPYAGVAMLSHWPEQIEVVRSRGLRCLHEAGNSSTHHFTITNDIRLLQPIRVALLLVKSYQTARAAYEMAPVMAADGLAITLQNGLGNLEILAAALGASRVAQGITAQGATMVEPGVVRHAGRGPTYVATSPGKGDLLRELVTLFAGAGLAAELASDVQSLQWSKLAVNAGINPLTALLRVKNGDLLSQPLTRAIVCAAASETAAVAEQLGIELSYEDPAEQVLAVAAATADNRSSMLQDVLRGAPTEVDAINGAIASKGREVGVPTPVNDELWKQVKKLVSTRESGNPATLLQKLKRIVG